jgi:acetolactate synthase-1/2/3 large subunit
MPTGALDARSVSAVIARLQPANCIVMDEALTVGMPYFAARQSRCEGSVNQDENAPGLG